VVLLVDAAQRSLDEDTRGIAARLAEARRPAILALNKVDAAPHARLLPFADELNRLAPFGDTFMISALTGDGVGDLRRAVAARLPDGPWLYPEDEITDMPMRLMAAEVTREKVFLRLHAELPYAVAVETESWEEFRDGSVRISQVIYVQRDSQKAIVLGRGGQMIKAIGAAARQDLEQALDRRVHLNLFVKVRDWVENAELYRPWGLDFNA